ncbi:hypothetical protein HanXRQr2_Chr04g0166811 [Helianthus annuus]|uniref:Uncharacterized protein n=1 Tax=Helianthus annuus TaxID=4232 RepID=A0A9K3NRK0_HELAN|nr:hypothetical protein HanXRQr2_Chr04g0166811 [Helianthus annuus]
MVSRLLSRKVGRSGWILWLLMQVMVRKRKRLVIGYGFGALPMRFESIGTR